eukprot:UN17171
MNALHGFWRISSLCGFGLHKLHHTLMNFDTLSKMWLKMHYTCRHPPQKNKRSGKFVFLKYFALITIIPFR